MRIFAFRGPAVGAVWNYVYHPQCTTAVCCVTKQSQTETEDTSLGTTTNVARYIHRCDVSVILTPSYTCQDLLTYCGQRGIELNWRR